jgi:hypothetical protein
LNHAANGEQFAPVEGFAFISLAEGLLNAHPVGV